MANAYTQIQIHAVFAVKNRASLIDSNWRERLYKYIIAIINSQKHKALAVGGTDDHVHILFRLSATQTVAELMRQIKRGSSEWINKNKLVPRRFQWQSGYGAFSYSKSQIPTVVKYIKNQEKHHKKTPFGDEYKKILDSFGIEYDEQYLFKTAGIATTWR